MRSIILIILLFGFVTGNAQQLTADANTLLLLNFNNSVNGTAGEVPIVANNITYQTGMQGNALYVGSTSRLRFAKLNNINTQTGTIEFWVRPEVAGTLLDMNPASGGLLVGLGTWTVMDVNLGVAGLTRSVTMPGIFQTNTWYHMAFTWDATSLKMYKNGQLQATTNVGYTLPDVNLSYFNIGSTNAGTGQLVCRLDELRISDRPRTPFEILQSYLAGNNVPLNNIQLVNSTPIQMYKTWKISLNNPGYWKTPSVYATYNNQNYTIPNEALQWSVADPTKAEIINNEVIAKSYGTTQLIGTFGNLSVSVTININTPVQEHETLPNIDPFLSNSIDCNEKLMPVVIIAYFPTLNTTHIDQSEADQWFPNDITLVQNAKTRVQGISKHTKFSLEEGSKFRGYSNANAKPYLGYKVVDVIYVYEPIPRNRLYGSDPNLFLFDPFEAVKRFGGENYVNNLGVKEFWIFGLGMSNVVMPESNMSSPTTGDISNSHRYNDDLPIYNKSYVVYGYNYSRIGNESVHNHGHQIESMMDHVNKLQDGNSSLFWNKFVGWGPNFSTPPIGRCGDTHHPPNTTQDYDYYNNTGVMSDIIDWTPTGGTQSTVSAATTWGMLNYTWPVPIYYNAAGNVIDNLLIDAQSNWYIMWMQSLPGFGQQIAYNSYYISNWWKIIHDWDNFYNQGLYRLYPDADPNACGPKCALTFSDPGGNTTNYGNNSKSIKIFCPDNPGDKVRISFSEFSTQAQYDVLYVHDGPDLNFPLINSGNGAGLGTCNVAGGFWGNLNNNLPGPFQSTHESGCLTFRFCSDASVTESGWNATISCITCTNSVSTTTDNIVGSLRWAIYCAAPNSTIQFSPALNNSILNVTNSPLILNKNLNFHQTLSTPLGLRSINSERILDISPGKTASLKYISLYSESGSTGRAIRNQGNLTLEHVNIFDQQVSGSTILNTGTINILGNVVIRIPD